MQMYVVQGVDPQGRKFCGLYTKSEAEYLVATDSLNKIIDIKTVV